MLSIKRLGIKIFKVLAAEAGTNGLVANEYDMSFP
jgi:hypothetical protein